MTVKELKEELIKYPDSMEVFMAERKTEFTFGIVNSAYIKEINFVDEPGGEVLCREKVVILDEE